jgi:transcriptional regulator with XRE-family HTH domain
VAPLSNPTLKRRQLGRLLRRFREDIGMTLDQAAPRLEWSPSKLSRIEKGQQSVDVHGVRSMLDLYDIGDRWAEVLDLAREARKKGWWLAYGIIDQGYLGLETDAGLVRDFQTMYVPGLMQTEAYARAVFRTARLRRTEAELDKQVAARMVRQGRLTAENPLELAVIVDECVLLRPVGGPEIMRAQLRHMVGLAGLPNLSFQVLPLSGEAHICMDGAFTLLSFPHPEDADVAYGEYPVGAVHVEKKADVDACRLVFDQLRSQALNPSESAALVERMAKQL